jgi:hypothetical protein
VANLQIGHWWNGHWGRLARRDVWLDQRPDGVFEIRWSGGDWGEGSAAKPGRLLLAVDP